MAQKLYGFDAFLSYSRDDSSFAKKLERQLESYLPPRGATKRRAQLNIFRDVQDLVGNELSVAICDALQESRHLIVVCSPSSRASEWVGKEIDEFMKNHESDGIVPVLLSGRPNNEVKLGEPPDQAFHDSFYKYLNEPVGADFRPNPSESRGQRRERERESRFQILAYLHGASKNDLLRRQHRKNVRILTSAATLFALLSIAFAWIAVIADRNEKEARRQQIVSRAGELSALASAALSRDPTLAFRLAEASLDLKQSYFAEKALWDSHGHPFYGHVLSGHDGAVNSVAFSPDGSRVVTASEDKTARVWDCETGEVLQVLEGHTDVVASATYSTTGDHIVTASYDKTACVWDAEAGKEIGVLEGHTGRVTSAMFSPDGDWIATTSTDKTVRLWSRETRKEKKRAPFIGPLTSGDLSSDGSLIAFTMNEKAYAAVIEHSSFKLMLLHGHAGDVLGVAFSPVARRLVTASFDRTAIMWSLEDGEILRIFSGHEEGIVGAEFSNDGNTVLTASMDRTARTWDAILDRRFVRTFTDSESVRVLPAPKRKSYGALQVFRGHTHSVTCAVFSPDGSLIATSSKDGTARLWLNAEALQVFRVHGQLVFAPRFSPDGTGILAVSSDAGSVALWDTATGERLPVLDGRSDIESAKYSPDGSQVLVVTKTGKAQLWDSQTGGECGALPIDGQGAYLADFSPKGARIVTLHEDNTARVWDAASTRLLHSLEGHTGPLTSTFFSADGTRIGTTSQDNTARLWDAATGKLLHTLKGHTPGGLTRAAYSPDGKHVVTVLERKVYVWDGATGRLLRTLEGHSGHVVIAGFSPDSTRIVTASNDKTARIWDAVTGKVIHTLRGHTGLVLNVVFSPRNGHRVLTWSDDGTARLWDSATGQILKIMRGHPSGIFGASFSADGELIATGSGDGRVHIWPGSAQALRKAINETKIRGPIRSLTENELKIYGFLTK